MADRNEKSMAMVPSSPPGQVVKYGSFNQEQVQIIKDVIAKGSTDSELMFFCNTAERMQLDPFAKQIHFIKRKAWDNDTKSYKEQVTIVVGIDGYRLNAERTGRYRPSSHLPKFVHDKSGKMVACQTYVWKRDKGEKGAAAWYKVRYEARFDEYAQYFKNDQREWQLTKQWQEKPYLMLAKCAEVGALRKAFPKETSGVEVAGVRSEAGEYIDVEVEEKVVAPTMPAPAAETKKKAPPRGPTPTNGNRGVDDAAAPVVPAQAEPAQQPAAVSAPPAKNHIGKPNRFRSDEGINARTDRFDLACEQAKTEEELKKAGEVYAAEYREALKNAKGHEEKEELKRERECSMKMYKAEEERVKVASAAAPPVAAEREPGADDEEIPAAKDLFPGVS